jgi:hypothetical protein
MKIMLTRNKFCTIDDDDYELCSKYKWHCLGTNDKYLYSARTENGKTILMHREILNCPNHLCVDHINGNTLDNRKENLRICTKAENNRNCKARSDKKENTPRGIYKRMYGYESSIRVDKKRIYIGHFKDIKTAILKRNEMMIKYHGKFARLIEVEE